jgi:hypothetical protein
MLSGGSVRLKYNSQKQTDASFCALINDSGRRIEFHLAAVENQIYMVALSGKYGQPASRQKAQGPFFTMELAAGSMRAICNSLVRTGYEQLINVKPHWQFQVLAELKQIRQAKNKNPLSFAFNPNDVYFD